MPHRNRVTPFGDIVAYPERGTFTGNRGILHDESGQLTNRRWTTQSWITCLLEFKGRQRTILSPHTWTELFFLDEATALAAGHRPCGECRRADFTRFVGLWRTANAPFYGANLSLREIDRIMHRERIMPRTRQKVTYDDNLDNLPTGAFVTLKGDNRAFLVLDEVLAAWSPDGYTTRLNRPHGIAVTVLTPLSTVRTLAAGYELADLPTRPGKDS